MSTRLKQFRGEIKHVLIDDEDDCLFNNYTTRVIKPALSHTFYVSCYSMDTKRYVGLLHRLIIKAWPSDIYDHANGNGLDCRKANLRLADGSLNQQNRRNSRRLMKGVWFRKDRGYWVARLTIDGKIISLGTFLTYEDAVEARLRGEAKYFPFAGMGTQYPEIMGYEY